jgi:DNA polymerase I-like protein with 3'-5' exonuclease and polymerase domains
MSQANNSHPSLLPQHRADLYRSGLTDDMIVACGFKSVTDPKMIRRVLGWDAAACGVTCCLGIPFPDTSGKLFGYGRLKPDTPRNSPKDGSPVRYESPRGKGNHAYFPPGVWDLFTDTAVPLILVEGEKKAAKAMQENFPAIGLVGVYGWQKKRVNKEGPRELIDDLEAICWEERTVYICFDSDITQKQQVAWAEWHLAEVLTAKNAIVRIVRLPAGPEGAKVGLDDFLVENGREALPALLEAATSPRWPDMRPDVLLRVEEHLSIEQAVKALARGDKDLYQRGGELVRISRPPRPPQQPPFTPRIEALSLPILRTRMTRYMRIMAVSPKDGELHPVHPTKWLVNGVSRAEAWPGVRSLAAVITAPVLLPDGTILQTPCYHAASGLFYVKDEEYPAIPEQPSRDDAQQAMRALLEPVCDFPFLRPEHRSAWLAAVLTPIARFAFNGPAPLFMIDANTRGCGKGLLADVASWVAMGREFAVVPYKPDAAEFEKTITAVALAGERIAVIDNVAGFLGNAALDAALTKTEWQGRILGRSEQPRVPMLTTWFATGNNIGLMADTSRRVCPIRLESLDENPEKRNNFRFPDLLAWVRVQHRRLLCAGLTLLSGYCRAGRPDQQLRPWGSYEGWSALVRGAIVWAGLPDPGLALEELATTADTEITCLRAMLAGWQELDPEGEGKTASAALNLLKTSSESSYPTLREALAEVFNLAQGKLPTARSLGYKLRKWRGRNVEGLCFEAKLAGRGTHKWFVRAINRGHQGGDEGNGGDQTPGFENEVGGPEGNQGGDGGDGGDQTPGVDNEGGAYGAKTNVQAGGLITSIAFITTHPAERTLPDGTPYRLLTAPDDLATVLQALDDSGFVGLDIETTGLNPHRDRVRLIQLATERGLFLLDTFTIGDVSCLWEHLGEVELVVHNAAFDLAFLWHLGFRPGKVYDLLLLSRLLTAGTRFGKKRSGNTLEDLAGRELGIPLDKSQQKANWSGGLSPEMLDYAALDAKVTRELLSPLRTQIHDENLDAVADIENRAVPAFIWLACSGAPFALEAWLRLAAEAEERERGIVERLDEAAPHREECFGPGAWKWNSHLEVKEAFAALGIQLDSTKDETLARVDHPLAAILREQRSAKNRVKNYGKSWQNFVQEGRIFAKWNQSGAATGRSSCSEPNLQGVPKDPRYRQCFTAPAGRVLVKADYSQVQLRIACLMTGERRMLEAYQSGGDLHTLTAQSITGKSEVSKQDRQTAKAVNFGLLFGLGAKGLQAFAKKDYGLELSQEEAETYRSRFFETYPALKRWHQREGQSSAKECRTRLGRRRLLDDKTRFTDRLNSPVQGAEADGAKLAMALLWERRDQCPGAFPILFVHDEIVVEAPGDQAEAAKEWLVTAMKDGMKDILAPVPCEVEAAIVPSWGGGE